ncbi:unnamed protein product [Spirodela intermedia]|uniref:Pectin acetylesterase n=1 Tax=Spirodela intermedia TaxID=51605 RepID=A0A7I8JPG8_SPIIN|nr:unnamed protein product [Spirodela intermedia]CAA6672078.1 unnamed protein product [Spirodela intermedia]
MSGSGGSVTGVLICCVLALMSSTAGGLIVNLTVLESATASGAVCLDGSPPAYHFAPGWGPGKNSWLVHMEGGGWCHSVENCLFRKRGKLGSSKAMGSIAFTGILNDHKRFNPGFYNWNKVKVRYCDGSSFTGDVESVDPVTDLHFRGARIFEAVTKHLLARGMKRAKNVLLSGCSAGGLTAILNCDRFRALLPSRARVKCLSDGGFFINANDVTGAQHIGSYFDSITKTHGSLGALPTSCTSKRRSRMCFFPQYVAQGINTPLFILNAAYDSWQIRNIMVPPGADPAGAWRQCRADISQCTPGQIQAMQGFRVQFLRALGRLGRNPSRGLLVNSCFAHCQSELTATWQFPGSPTMGNRTIAEGVSIWFYDRSSVERIDGPYPRDASCHNNIYIPSESLEEVAL